MYESQEHYDECMAAEAGIEAQAAMEAEAQYQEEKEREEQYKFNK
jgi:hypothetical protein